MHILSVEIQTDDLIETEAFYAQVIGLPITGKDQHVLSLLAGQSTLRFTQSNNRKPKYHFAFNIPSNQLNEAVAWASSRVRLIENGDEEIINDFKSWNARAIYFYDNNGNILEFIARFDLDNAIHQPFSSASILSVSEIRIVADHPAKLAEALTAENGLCFFGKGIKMDDFIPLGNDDGLLIVVANNRTWFPTAQKAEQHYTKIKIATGGSTRELVYYP